jgi:hypothetical protein
MYGLDFTRGILQSAIPYAFTTTIGNAAESASNKQIIKLAGKVLQMLPAAIRLYDTLQDKVWDKLLSFGIHEINFMGKNIKPEALSWIQSVGNPKKRLMFARFRTPIITSTIASALLFAPLILKGLETIAHKYEYTRIKSGIANTDWFLMKVIKVASLCLYAFGIHEALAITSPALIGVYSLFFLGNLYILLSPLRKTTALPQT